MSRKVMIEVDDNDIDDFVERGIVRAEVARNAVLITESNDCVSREAVLELSYDRYDYTTDKPIEVVNVNEIKALPSVLPKCNPDKNVKTHYFHDDDCCPKEREDKE